MKLKEEKLNYIIQYALEHFQKFGFSKVTMDEIAKGTGTGKATLYRYFPSKEELLVIAIEKNIKEMEEKIKLEVAGNQNLVEKLNRFLGFISQMASRVQAEQLADIERNVPSAYQLICDTRRRVIFENMTAMIEEGKREGIFREELDTKYVVGILIGAAEYMTKPEVLDTMEGTNLFQVIESLIGIILEGCYSEAGRKPIQSK